MFYNSDTELENIIKNAGTCIVLEKDTEKLEKLGRNAVHIAGAYLSESAALVVCPDTFLCRVEHEKSVSHLRGDVG